MEREVRRRVEILEYMRWKESQGTRQKPFTHRDVGRLVAFYYKEPGACLQEARDDLAQHGAALPSGSSAPMPPSSAVGQTAATAAGSGH